MENKHENHFKTEGGCQRSCACGPDVVINDPWKSTPAGVCN